MIDYHCHILPGLDDGCHDLDASLELARLLVAAGIDEVYCTPHCLQGVYDNDPPRVEAAAAELQSRLDEAGLALKLRAGMEYYLDEFLLRSLKDLRTLGDSDLLLVEPSTHADPEQVCELVFQVVRAGYTPVLAHPERYAFLDLASTKRGALAMMGSWFKKRTEPLEKIEESVLGRLRGMGCRFQGNLGSLAGYYGSRVQQRALRLQQLGFYSLWGSDAHGPDSARQYLVAGLDVLGRI